MGWENGLLGYPKTDELTAPDKIGRFNHFQGGCIYWTPATGAHEVHGAIRDLWASMGWERSLLGYPETDELTGPDKIGRLNHFQGGSIYWTPATGAHEVHGDVRIRWGETGWERGPLGYPRTSEFRTFDLAAPEKRLRISAFQHGFIAYSEADRTTRVVVPASYSGLTLLVVPIFWGTEWNSRNPTWAGQGWTDVDRALDQVLSAGVASGLQGYGIAAAVKVKGTWRENDPVPQHFRELPGFTQGQLQQGVNDAIFKHGAPAPVHSHSFFEGLPPLTSLLSVYLVFLPSGCHSSEYPDAAGYHMNCNFHDPQGRLADVEDIKVCWVGQGSDRLSDTLMTALHELVEAADDAADREIGDRCAAGDGQNMDNAGFDGTVAEVTLRSYWSNFHNRCILPPLPDPETGLLALQ
jgi:hypothetical protein